MGFNSIWDGPAFTHVPFDKDTFLRKCEAADGADYARDEAARIGDPYDVTLERLRKDMTLHVLRDTIKVVKSLP